MPKIKSKNLSDWQLVERYYKGDDQAITELTMKYYEKMIGLAYHYTGDRDISGDVVQDVIFGFLKIDQIDRAQKFRPEPTRVFSSISLRVKNKAIEYFRRKVRERENIQVYTELRSENVTNDYEKRFSHQELEQAKIVLSELEVEVLKLEMQGYKNDEITEILELTEELRVVKQRIKRKLKREILNLRNSK